MGTRYAPSGHGWLVFGLLLTLTGAASPPRARPSLRGKPEARRRNCRRIGMARMPSRSPTRSPRRSLPCGTRTSATTKGWAAAARKLAQIGKPAVPALIEELDRTTENRPLRSLGFTLRAIGDPGRCRH